MGIRTIQSRTTFPGSRGREARKRKGNETCGGAGGTWETSKHARNTIERLILGILQSYRSEDFRRAAELYAELASNNGQVENEYVDLRINSSAVDAQLEWNGQESLVQKQKPSREDLEAFETAYNAACGSIARDELGQAEVLLRRAKGGFFREDEASYD